MRSPVDGSLVGTIPAMSQKDADAVIAQSKQAQTMWAHTPISVSYTHLYTSSADVPFRQALASLENGSELDVGWRLPVADGSLPGVNVELATCVDDEGIGHVRLTYSLVDDV